MTTPPFITASLRRRERGEHALASRTRVHRPLQSGEMRKGALRTHSFALIGILVLLAACSAPAAPGASSQPPTATVAAVATPEPTLAPDAPCKDCWPLTGKPLKLGSADKRALLVKIDNVPLARPHYGITQADMVFEILVEGLATRLAVVFHSQDPQTIGNIRSARLADRSLTPMVRGALVYSGTSAYEMPLIQGDAANGKYIDLSADYTSGYYRVTFRPGPYNMFTSAAAMRQAIAAHGADSPQQVPAWGFLAATDHAPTIAGMSGGIAATELTIPYREDISLVKYQYDAETRTYARFQNNAGKAVRDVDAVNSQPIAAANVAIIHTEVWEVPQIVDAAGSHAHDMRLTGTGAATIFRDGLRQEATWSRASDTDPFIFKNAAGERILLSQGQTWVHVIPNDWETPSQ
ncbi:MAG: DUF3048 domain-containing protein [Chloroflexi bacterium]|nr:MAG: DUF3048 domain-containing protein [Chloroflexota bacterium]